MNTGPTTPTPTSEPSCGACAFWDRGNHSTTGLCRRWGPDRLAVTDSLAVLVAESGWPTTGPDDWCGEFEAADPVTPMTP